MASPSFRTGVLVLGAAFAIGGCSRGGTRDTSPPPRNDAGAVVVRISYGSEKRALVEDSIAAFHRASPRTAAGRPIRIEAVAEGSAESMEAILAGRSAPTVWSPASSLLVDVLNARWAEARGGLGTAPTLAPESPPILLSPVVIAMWEPMARALGWPNRAIGWSDLADLASNPKGWASHGHPEWGAFKFGHTHPLYSNSGAMALVAATWAGAGKAKDLSLDDVSRAAPFVRRVQAGVVHYGRSTGFFAEKMFTRGPAYLSAAVLYENLVVESGLESKYRDKPFPVVAVYPREGTYWSDHPYAVLELPSTTAETKEAALSFRRFLMSPERQRIALQRFGFRPADPQVPLGPPLDPAHGVDASQPTNVLPNPPVAVTRRVLESFEQVKRPVAITFVLDTSGSMAGEPLRQAKAGARVFLDALPASDAVRLLLFANEPRWMAPEPAPVGSAKPALLAAIDGAFAAGGTALYDAVLEAGRPARGDPRGAARAVIVLTDGEDTDSRTNLDAVLARLRQQSQGEVGAGAEPPRVFAIGYGPKADAAVLRQIADAGGGAFFAGTPRDIQAVYAELATFF